MKPILCTDMTKQNEFAARLSAIINKPDSSIAIAFMAELDHTVLFLATEAQVKKGINLEVKDSGFEFNFVSPFMKGFHFKEMLASSGISDADLTDITVLLDDYTFLNPAEGEFFASKFFYNEAGKINSPIVYLKFQADESLNTCVIDGKNLHKSYGFIKAEKLAEILVPSLASATLVELKPSPIVCRSDRDFVLNRIKDMNLTEVVCEVYSDMLTGKRYAGNIVSVVDGKTVEKSVTTIL